MLNFRIYVFKFSKSYSKFYLRSAENFIIENDSNCLYIKIICCSGPAHIRYRKMTKWDVRQKRSGGSIFHIDLIVLGNFYGNPTHLTI